MRPTITGVKTARWQVPQSQRALVPAMGGRPPISAAPVSLVEGPVIEERVFRVGGWGVMSDRARVKKIRKMAEEYGNDPRLRWWVVNDVLRPAGVQPRDFRGQLQAIFSWVQNNVHYTNESTEQIQAPWWTIKHRTGDCDDMALLLGAMLTAVGHPFRLVLAGQDRRDGRFKRWVEGEPQPGPVDYVHIYLLAGTMPLDPQHSQWLAMEPTLRGVPLGYDVTVQGLPGGVQAADLGSGSGRPLAGYGMATAIPWGTSATVGPVSVARQHRVDNLQALRSLPPLEAIREVGMSGFFTDWLDWHKLTGAAVESAMTAILIAAVFAGLRKAGVKIKR